jgi:hypothetical protein
VTVSAQDPDDFNALRVVERSSTGSVFERSLKESELQKLRRDSSFSSLGTDLSEVQQAKVVNGELFKRKRIDDLKLSSRSSKPHRPSDCGGVARELTRRRTEEPVCSSHIGISGLASARVACTSKSRVAIPRFDRSRLTRRINISAFGTRRLSGTRQCCEPRDIARPDLPIRERGITEKTVGKELPRELEELLALRAIEKEKVLEERPSAEGRLRHLSSGDRA